MPNKDIFLVENTAQLILSAIETHDFPGQVFSERINNLYNLLNLDRKLLLASEEEQLLTEIITLLEELTDNHAALYSPDNIKKWFNQFFKALYEYIMLRASTILKHVSQSAYADFYQTKEPGIPKIYCSPYWGNHEITTTFEDHAKARQEEIRRYFRSPAFNEIIAILHELVPGILEKKETFTDIVHERSNAFSEPGIWFVAPPFIQELAEIAKFLRPYYLQTSIPKEHVLQLEAMSRSFSTFVKFSKVASFLKSIYTPIEYLSHWPLLQTITDKHRQYLHLYFMFSCIISRHVSYDLQERNDNKINMAINKIKRNTANKKSLIEAARTLLYSNIPWLLLRNIGMYSLIALRNTSGYFASIVYSAIDDMAENYTEVLSYLREIVNFELDVITNEVDYAKLVNNFKPIAESHFAQLKTMGEFAGDIIFLNKVISTLDGLKFNSSFTVATLLRILGILGECAKNISALAKSFFNNRFMFKLAEIRDKVAHVRGFSRSLQETLEQYPGLMNGLQDDFNLLLKETRIIINQFPQTWDEVKKFYLQNSTSHSTATSKLGRGLDRMLEYLDTTLAPDDRATLRNTKHARQLPDLTGRDYILSVLQGSIPATSKEKDRFSTHTNNLTPPLSNKQNKALIEAYKNLIQNKPIEINKTIIAVLKNITALDGTQLDHEIETLINDLKRMSKIDNLKERLVPLGLINTLDVWEEKRQKYFSKPAKANTNPKNNNNNNAPSADETNSDATSSKEQLLQDSINSAKRILRHLDSINQLTRYRRKRVELEKFWNNPMLCFAVEYHFTQIRVNIDTIHDALTHLEEFRTLDSSILALNTLYRILATKLSQVRLYGNGLAHLHDVTEINSLTTYGQRWAAYNQLYLAIDGLPYGNQEHPSHFPSLYEEIKMYIQEINQAKSPNNQARTQSVQRDNVSVRILVQRIKPTKIDPASYLTKAKQRIPVVEGESSFVAVIFDNPNLAEQFSQALLSAGFSLQNGQPLPVYYPDPDEAAEYSVHISDKMYNILLNDDNACADLINKNFNVSRIT